MATAQDLGLEEIDLLDENLEEVSEPLAEDLYDPTTEPKPAKTKAKAKTKEKPAKAPKVEAKPVKAKKPAATPVKPAKATPVPPKAKGKAEQAKGKITKAEKAKAPVWKKTGLRLPQVRILQFLAKCKKDVNRKEISAGANCDYAWLNGWIGSHNEATRKRSDEKLMSLITLKAVDFHELPDPKTGKETIYYRINAKGLKLLKELQ